MYALRVPLDAEDAVVSVFDRFGDAVRGPLCDGQPGADPAAALMVGAVDLTDGRAEGGKGGAGTGPDGMGLVLAGPAVKGGGRQILDQAAAEIDIEDLHAAADAKDRFSGFEEGVKQGKLRFIQRAVDAGGALILLPEPGRVDIAAAGQQKPVIR